MKTAIIIAILLASSNAYAQDINWNEINRQNDEARQELQFQGYVQQQQLQNLMDQSAAQVQQRTNIIRCYSIGYVC